ncbi:hypothetical protein SHIRM173S_12847 [Streptomyces hirsutus]
MCGRYSRRPELLCRRLGLEPGQSCAGGALSARRPGAMFRGDRTAARGRDGRGSAMKPPVGVYIVDTRTERIGIVMGHEGPYIQLRPYGGGREWDAETVEVRRATPAERLRAATAYANARSRGELP